MSEKTNLQKLSQVHGLVLGMYTTTSRADPMWPVIEEAFYNVIDLLSVVAQADKAAGIEQPH